MEHLCKDAGAVESGWKEEQHGAGVSEGAGPGNRQGCSGWSQVCVLSLIF